MKTKTSTPDAPAITFRTNVMIPASAPGTMSTIITAGEPSPWTDISQVPATLRSLIGVPNFDPPPNTPNQFWIPKAQLEAERQAFEALNTNDDLGESLREELDARGREYLRDSAQRNETETESENREEQDRKRLVREMEAEAAAKLRGYKS